MTSLPSWIQSLRHAQTERSTRRRFILQSTALTAGITALASGHPSARAQSSTFTLAANWAPADIDPHSGYDPGSGFVLCGIYEGLLRQVPGDPPQLAPQLAETWESNADASSWTFHLRPGVTFQDGTPLTAEAARASFVRQMTLQLAPANVLGRFLSSPDQIVAVDERTLRFDLGRSRPNFPVALSAPFGAAIMNVSAALAHEVDGDLGHGWCQTNAEGLGTGPYRLVDYDPRANTVLERFDGYWGGWSGNHFDTIVFRSVAEAETRRELIEQGEVDLVQNIGLDSVDDLMSDSSLVVDRRTDMMVRYLAITQVEPFDSPVARQALCFAFPYEDVLHGVWLGFAEPAQGAVSPNTAGFSPSTSVFTTDLEKAQTLLAEAGVPVGTKIWTVVAMGAPIVQTIAELFQHNLQQIGIELEIEVMDYASYVGMAYSDLPAEERPNLLPSFWEPDYDDAWNQLYPMVSCDAWLSGNIGHYCNDEVDELLHAADNATDTDVYLATLARIQQIVGYDDPTGIYFALPEWISVLRHDIGGYQLHPVVSSYLDYYALYRST